MLESAGGRKFIIAILGVLLLFAAFMLGKVSDTVFVGGLGTLILGYGAENLVTKKILETNGGKKK